jgi:pimeloyl-ACP methyl ester carboxylesterase
VPAAVLVVGGWGSSCCEAGDGLRAALPGVTVRQFSYRGLGANGRPLPSGADADDLPLPVLGDRLAGQVEALHAVSGKPVDIVAESEGTLAVYAMLDRHPGLPVGAIVLLSPIVEPGQLSYPAGDATSVSEEALDELNSLVGSISPYGAGGAADLLNSVSEFGAKYFADVATGAGLARGADGKRIRWLSVVPLADAVTLPVCSLPAGVLVVPALHGGLLGDPTVLPMVAQFLSGRPVSDPGDAELRSDAELISSVATAWRMPVTTAACPG